MKTKLLIFVLSLFVFTACSKDDEPMVNQAPKAFTVTTTVDGNSVTLNWTTSIDPEGETIKYNVILDGNQVASNLTTTSYKVENLTYEKAYSGKVEAVDPEGLSTASNFNFNIASRPNTAPSAVVLGTPSSGETSVALQPELTWQAATDAEGDVIVYDVYLDESANPTTKIAENLSGTSYTLNDKLKNNTTFYWKIIAKDNYNAETSSVIASFTTRDLVTATVSTEEPGFADRSGHTSVVFKDKMFVIAGASCCGGRFNDVWSSEDGETWAQVTADAEFPARVAHASVVYNGKIWVTGGNSSYSAGREFTDVWYSEDGENWKLATNNAAFGPRYGHKMVVYDNKMWIIGGRDQNTTYGRNQVWNSTNGIDWTLVSEDTGYNTNLAEFIVFQDKIWRFGGYTNANVYSTTDGITWNLEAENMPFGQRHNHKVTIWDDKVWLISGSDRATNELVELPDVWYTEDGKNWILAAADAGYQEVAQHTVLTYNNKIWIIGGGGGWQSFFVTNDVWALTY